METTKVTGILWRGVCPPAAIGEWVLVEGPTTRPEWAEVNGKQPVAGGTFVVRPRDNGTAVVLGATVLEWRHGHVKRPWPRAVRLR